MYSSKKKVSLTKTRNRTKHYVHPKKRHRKPFKETEVICYPCRKKGHFVSECRSRRYQFGEGNPARQGKKNFHEKRKSDRNATFVADLKDVKEDEKLITRRAHTWHNEKKFYKYFRALGQSVCHYREQGENLKLERKGTILIKPFIYDLWEDDVLLVLDLPKRKLFSEKVMTEKGTSVIKKGAMDMLLLREWKKNICIYKMLSKF